MMAGDSGIRVMKSYHDIMTDNLEQNEDHDECIASLDDIRQIRRGCQVPREGLMCDLLWADPQVQQSPD